MSRKLISRAVVCALLASAWAPVTTVFAAQWKPSLLPPADTVRKPEEPLQFEITNLPAGAEKRMSVELDDLDITAVLQRKGGVFVYTPAQPLTKGKHVLRIVEFAPDGNIIEQGRWEFEIRKTKRFRDASYQLNATLNLTQRIDHDNIIGLPKNNTENAAVQIQGAVANKNWRLKANMDLVYNSQVEQTARGEKWDMGTFLITHNTGSVETNIGHHQVGPDSLIMEGLNRRGVSVKYSKPETGFGITGFAMRTQDVIGFQEGLGVGDADNRINGVTLTSRPLSGNRNAMAVNATVLSGEGPEQSGVAVGGDTTSSSGSAASVVVDGNFHQQKMRLRGEVAASRYDADGADPTLSKQNDNAHALLWQYTPWTSKQIKGKPITLQFGVENKRLGTFFRSIANPAPINDRFLWRGFVQLNYSGFDFQASVGTEKDNVNDDDVLPQTKANQFIIGATYTPQQELGDDGQPKKKNKWLGQPSYSLAYVNSEIDVISAGSAGTLSTGAFTSTKNLQLTATFTHNTWDWNIGYSLGKETDFTNLNPDTKNRSTDIGANFRIGEKISLAPTVQWNVTENRDTGGETTTLTTGIAFNYTYKKITSSVGINLNRERAPGDTFSIPTRRETRDITGNITWNVVAPRAKRPGVSFSLEGQHQKVTDEVDPTQSTESYQIFFKTTISWGVGNVSY